MATARLFIPVGTQTFGPIPGGVDITETIGSNTAEIISIAANGNVLLDGSFVRGNDCIKILGNSGDYSISASVAGITITAANGAVIRIPSFGPSGGLKIDFLDVQDVDLFTDDGTVFKLDGPILDQTITSTSAPLSLGGTGGGGGGGGGSDDEFIELTVAGDNRTGSRAGGSGDTTFEAIISPNQNGEQTNTLQSGDRLDGGGGYNTLDAEVQSASALNGDPVAEIVLRTTRVDHLKFNAQQAEESSDTDAVELDAERAYGVQMISSAFSDADLIVYNVNTMGDGGPSDPANGLDNGRTTSSITICMEHTAPSSPLFCASDLEVYFDADYLIPGAPERETQLRLQLLDIDNQITNSRPLQTNPFDRIILNFADGTVVTLQITAPRNNLSGAPAYSALITSINAAIAAADPLTTKDLSTFSASLGAAFTVVDPDGSPGGPASGFEIIITDTSGQSIVDVQFGASGAVPGNTDYQKQIFINTDDTPDLITSNLCVLKVGQGGDGGEFIVGSMSTGGIERFILEVKGYDAGTGGVNVDQDSSLAELATTNNTLMEVILIAEADVTADIVIGNSNTTGLVPNIYEENIIPWAKSDEYGEYEECGNEFDPNPCDLSDSRNNALRDVQLFTSAALNAQIDVTLWAHLSAAFTPKYLNLMDTDGDPKADNVTATYLFGGGNDVLNMNIAQENFAFVGASTREDFSFYTDTGKGNDQVYVQIGDGYAPGNVVIEALKDGSTTENPDTHWYTNHLLNENLVIITGDGDDFVYTWGATAAVIELGAGNDIAYTDNSGGGYGFEDGPFIDQRFGTGFNCCRPVWVFNQQNTEVNNLLSMGRGSVANAKDLAITVQYMDIIVKYDVPGTKVGNGTTVTDLMINQAIKLAVNTDPVLSAFLVARDGPSGTLLVLSKVDGFSAVTDFSLTLGASSTTTPGSGLGFAALGSALNAIGFNSTGTPRTEVGSNSRWDSQFGTDGLKTLSGEDSVNINNNRVYAGPGNDRVALSSNATSIEHYVIKKDESFGTDYVLNFTAAIEDEVIPAETEIQELCFMFDETLPDEVFQDTTLTLGIPGVGVVTVELEAGDDLLTVYEDIIEAIDDYIEGSLEGVSDLDTVEIVDGCLVFTWDEGVAVGQISGVIAPTNPTQTVVVTITGSTTASIPVDGSISFGGFATGSVDLPDGATAAQAATALADAYNDVSDGSIVAAAVGATIVFETFLDEEIVGDPIIGFTSASTLLDGSTTQNDFVPFASGFDDPIAVLTVVNEGSAEINPAFGYDIFDIRTITGGKGPGFFLNTQQLDGGEYAAVDAVVDQLTNGVVLIDRLAGTAAEFAYSAAQAAPAGDELGRLREMVTAADGTTQTTASTHLVITVDSNPGDPDGTVGRFYQVNDGTGARDATVTFLGTVWLGGYDINSNPLYKDPIGNWDAMTIANFTYQSPTELMSSYSGGII
jgi:hypothetical protein